MKQHPLTLTAWFTAATLNAEPGTKRGFFHRQNSLRVALIAAITLNRFGEHCDRLKMSNIA
jgi:alpha-L-arabinofuranosidase